MFSTGLSARTRFLYRQLIRESLLCIDRRARTYLCDRIRREFRAGKETPRTAIEALAKIREANETGKCLDDILEVAYGRRGAVRDELIARIADHAKPIYRTLVESQVAKSNLRPFIRPEEELGWIRERNSCRKHAETIWKSVQPPIPITWRLALENGARTGYDGNELPRKLRERNDLAFGKGTNDHGLWEARKKCYQSVLEKVPVFIQQTPSAKEGVYGEDADTFTYLRMLPHDLQSANPYARRPGLPIENTADQSGTQPSKIASFADQKIGNNPPDVSTTGKYTESRSLMESESSPGLTVFREVLALGPNIVVGRSPLCKSEMSDFTGERIVKDIHKWGFQELADENRKIKKGKIRLPPGHGKFHQVQGLPIGELAEVLVKRKGIDSSRISLNRNI